MLENMDTLLHAIHLRLLESFMYAQSMVFITTGTKAMSTNQNIERILAQLRQIASSG
jgi:hypothetical protein